ncbi:hypothetical protein ACFQ8C_13950 [Streptomyces sp. NPDC056503]|uniref:hypothetical protein n=1 Tax=Streptomyces sp. NPDC056503 TaxID=3345842 RepID=UPI0036955F3C
MRVWWTERPVRAVVRRPAGRIEASWAGLRARRRTLRAANHRVLTDHAATVPRLRAAGLVTDAVRDGLVGPGDAAASFAAVRRELRGFLGPALARARLRPPAQ